MFFINKTFYKKNSLYKYFLLSLYMAAVCISDCFKLRTTLKTILLLKCISNFASNYEPPQKQFC